MADILQCSRCGAVVRSNDYLSHIVVLSDEDVIVENDICPDCEMKLKSFFDRKPMTIKNPRRQK